MSTAAISTPITQQQQYFQTRQQDLQQLGQALKSGDLAAAKAAFTAITSLGQSGPIAGGNAFRISQRQQDFNAIGQALQSGNLSAAQNAFAALKASFRAGGGGNPSGTLAQSAGASGPGPEIIINLSTNATSSSASSGNPSGTLTQSASGSSSTAGPEIVLNLGNSSGSGPEQITINLSNSSSGEQVSLAVGNQGSPSQEFQINLPANSNEQIVLNLLNSSSSTTPSTTGTSSPAAGGLSVTA